MSIVEQIFATQNSLVLQDAMQQRWLFFHHPIAVFSTTELHAVIPTLQAVEAQVNQKGYYAAGFISYEASSAFDDSLVTHSSTDFPLVWFGLFTEPEVLSFEEFASLEIPKSDAIQLDWQPNLERSHYQHAIQKIKQYISQGDTYQVNYSFRLQAEFNADPGVYFQQLNQAQKGLYSAFVNLEDWAIACASPELFFQWRDRTLISRPMKGTAPRGLTFQADQDLAQALKNSPKNQAENVMIVDMIRNDMGRIAQTGTVQVPRLFDVEQYPTLWQMTSPVQCETDANFVEILQAFFPCASITGAPKPRTMQIIQELETTPRRIYTGTIGFLAPNRTAQFNVAIRTVLIDKALQQAEYGVGGGIVWDSVETSEYEECCTKAKVLTQKQPPFELLESILWTPEQGYFLLDLHLQRLEQSAHYFAFNINREAVEDQLRAIASSLPAQPHKIRLLVHPSGHLTLTTHPLVNTLRDSPLQVAIASTPVNSSNPFLYHKTTHRIVYEQAYKQAEQDFPDCDDVLLWNERGEITESCIANVIVEWQGQWYTPPVDCGLLAGTYRQWLLQQGKVRERVIRVEDLKQCTQIFLVNSVRQMQTATIMTSLAEAPVGTGRN